jgi:hypothetical protein
MAVSERVIVYQTGAFWVRDCGDRYTVYRDGATHATADSSYPRTPDGLSVAKTRADYCAVARAGKVRGFTPGKR